MNPLRKWLGLKGSPAPEPEPLPVVQINIITVVQAQIAQFRRDYGVAPRRIELGAMEMAAVRRLHQKASRRSHPPVPVVELLGLPVTAAKRASMIALS